jgi:hypothetical protein
MKLSVRPGLIVGRSVLFFMSHCDSITRSQLRFPCDREPMQEITSTSSITPVRVDIDCKHKGNGAVCDLHIFHGDGKRQTGFYILFAKKSGSFVYVSNNNACTLVQRTVVRFSDLNHAGFEVVPSKPCRDENPE